MISRRGLLQGASLLFPSPASAAFAIFQTSAPVAGPATIVASADGRSFVNAATGQPWIMLCDSAQAMVNIYGSDLNTYLTTRASQGFNAIQYDLIATGYVNATTPYAAQTAGGPVYAFTNNGAIQSGWTSADANSAFWTLMDGYISTMNTLGMVAVLNPYEGNGGTSDLVNAGNTACYNFGAFLGARYKNSNVIWQLGNDTLITSTTIYNAFYNLAQGILSQDSNHLITIEVYTSTANAVDTTFEPNSNGRFNWMTINGVYTYGSTYGETIVAYNPSGTSFDGNVGTNNASPAPVILLEANYVGENLTGDGSTPITYRKQAWWLTLGGGLGGYIFGTHWTWDFSSGWQSELTQGVPNVQVWLAFFYSIAFQTLIPDQARALATTGSTGWNTPNVYGVGSSFSSDAYICMAADNLSGSATLAVAYFPQASQSITISLSKFASTITAQWVDPTTGTKTSVSGSPFTNTGTHAFAPSGNNAAGDPDWTLLLTA